MKAVRQPEDQVSDTADGDQEDQDQQEAERQAHHIGNGVAEDLNHRVGHARFGLIGITHRPFRQLFGTLLGEADLPDAEKRIVIAKRAVRFQHILQRQIRRSVAHLVQHLVPGLLGIDIAVHERFQHRNRLIGIVGGEHAAGEQGDDDGQDAGKAPDQAGLVSVPDTQGHDQKQDKVDYNSHSFTIFQIIGRKQVLCFRFPKRKPPNRQPEFSRRTRNPDTRCD